MLVLGYAVDHGRMIAREPSPNLRERQRRLRRLDGIESLVTRRHGLLPLRAPEQLRYQNLVRHSALFNNFSHPFWHDPVSHDFLGEPQIVLDDLRGHCRSDESLGQNPVILVNKHVHSLRCFELAQKPLDVFGSLIRWGAMLARIALCFSLPALLVYGDLNLAALCLGVQDFT